LLDELPMLKINHRNAVTSLLNERFPSGLTSRDIIPVRRAAASLIRRHCCRGFTLIELAIVLVVIGLLLGGILKGQELIESARARNLISQMDSIKAAYFTFQDKYRAVPGDYPGALARANLSGIANDSVGGNADGVVRDTSQARESLLVWVHLAHANLISGNYQSSGSLPDSAAEWPRNPYGATLQLQYDALFSGSGGVPRLSLKTGNQVPARILAEIDRKIDDGRANSGQFRFSAYDGGGGPPSENRCFDAQSGLWRAAENEANCGAAALF
jgi:prepilin-type N-terminal cleavage/methylation domain-containing protein